MLRKEKFDWITSLNSFGSIAFERIEPDVKNNWINQTDNDFDTLLPIRIKGSTSLENQVFLNSSLGISTNRDEWVYDNNTENLENKIEYFISELNQSTLNLSSLEELSTRIKWSRDLRSKVATLKKPLNFDTTKIVKTSYRPFITSYSYLDKFLIDRFTESHVKFKGQSIASENTFIHYTDTNSEKPFMILASKWLADLHFVGAGAGTMILPLYIFDSENQKHENITDWALNQFQTHYNQANSANITKQDIFYYTYGVLHSPQYRKKYEQNLKREFPRLPFYEDFAQWRDWGERLMDLHINYETQEAFALERKDLDLTAKQKIKQAALFGNQTETQDEPFIAKPKTKLRADKINGTIEIDSHTQLTGVPALAWEYKLGNRSAIEWILDQYKERTPKDATIAERFNTYKFEDYKEQVIDLLKRVCNISVKTMEIINKMPSE